MDASKHFRTALKTHQGSGSTPARFRGCDQTCSTSLKLPFLLSRDTSLTDVSSHNSASLLTKFSRAALRTKSEEVYCWEGNRGIFSSNPSMIVWVFFYFSCHDVCNINPLKCLLKTISVLQGHARHKTALRTAVRIKISSCGSSKRLLDV